VEPIDITVGGARLRLLPQRAALLLDHATLLVADAHIGKAVSFRRLGVPVPQGTTSETLARLTAVLQATGARRVVFLDGRRFELEVVDPLDVGSADDVAAGGLRAPMPGKVIAHLAEVGAKVTKGTPLLVLEAMKMEMTVSAPSDGVLASFRFAPGEQVPEGAELVIITEAP